MTLGNSSAAQRRTHSANGETCNGERRNAGWGLEQGAARPGCYSAGTRTLEAAMRERGEWVNPFGRRVTRPERDALRPGSGIGHGTPIGGLEKGAVRPGCHSRGAARLGNRRGKRRGTQFGQWLCREPPHRGNCAATMSVRSAFAVRPEQGEAAVPLPVSSSYAAVMGKQPELVVRSNRRV